MEILLIHMFGERVGRVVKEAGKIIGMSRQDFETLYTDLLGKKLTDVMNNASHPLHERLSSHLIV